MDDDLVKMETSNKISITVVKIIQIKIIVDIKKNVIWYDNYDYGKFQLNLRNNIIIIYILEIF